MSAQIINALQVRAQVLRNEAASRQGVYFASEEAVAEARAEDERKRWLADEFELLAAQAQITVVLDGTQ